MLHQILEDSAMLFAESATFESKAFNREGGKSIEIRAMHRSHPLLVLGPTAGNDLHTDGSFIFTTGPPVVSPSHVNASRRTWHFEMKVGFIIA